MPLDAGSHNQLFKFVPASAGRPFHGAVGPTTRPLDIGINF